MPAPFPHHYEVELTWQEGRQGRLSAPPRPDLQGGPPPEFDGKPEHWSPEHLLIASANLCLMATFFSLAGKQSLAVGAFSSLAEGTLERGREGILFTNIALRVTLQVAAADREKAEQLLQSAKKYCIVTNSLKVPVSLEASVSVS